MNTLINQVGGQGMAEIILSLTMTRAILPNCYLHDFKVYGHVCKFSDAVFIFDEEEGQFMPYMPLSEVTSQITLLEDLKKELELKKLGAGA